jgi:hypothetical protein
MHLNVITNCTSLKKRHLKTITSFEEVMYLPKASPASWLQALKDNPEQDKAINVYAGEHWSIARDLYISGAALWVISAGYGLINSNDYIANYDATFSSSANNHVGKIYGENAVHKANLRWWEEISKSRQSVFGQSTKVSSIVNASNEGVFIFAVSPSYLKVIENELIELVKNKRLTKENCLIVSSKVVICESLLSMHVEANADLCSQLGGTRGSLNIRLAKYLVAGITKGGLFSKVVRAKYKALVNASVPATKYNRKRLDDEQVKKVILSILDENSNQTVSATTFLKIFRGKGLACEQKRFGVIFKMALISQ